MHPLPGTTSALGDEMESLEATLVSVKTAILHSIAPSIEKQMDSNIEGAGSMFHGDAFMPRNPPPAQVSAIQVIRSLLLYSSASRVLAVNQCSLGSMMFGLARHLIADIFYYRLVQTYASQQTIRPMTNLMLIKAYHEDPDGLEILVAGRPVSKVRCRN
jgi:hypothetical protein